jgi:hypothetical protein
MTPDYAFPGPRAPSSPATVAQGRSVWRGAVAVARGFRSLAEAR